MKYTIYQIPFPKTPEEEANYIKYSFRSLDMIDEVKASNYEAVYSGEIDDEDVDDALEKLFAIFNINHPEDYKGHSMSVSDIVEVDGKFYYCDSIGWKEVDLK